MRRHATTVIVVIMAADIAIMVGITAAATMGATTAEGANHRGSGSTWSAS
ncbi:hypothetical protein [Muricoccus nepalensis]|nr:hypothetical protein [Roseomonas nepalensis]